MIRINDKYNLMPELFDLWPRILVKNHDGESDMDILPTWDDSSASAKPTIIVCTEPNAHHAHIVFADLLARRPNSHWAITHTSSKHPWQVPNTIFWPSNLIMTVRVNDPTKTWTLSPKKYEAAALLGGWTPSRCYLFYWLKRSGLLERSLVNFRPRPNQQLPDQLKDYFVDYQSPEIPSLDDPRFQQRAYLQGGKINTMTPIDSERHEQNWVSQIVPWNIYDQCWISLIAETDVRGFLPSEKIAKPIMAAQPWIVFAGKHFLKRFHQLGFQSFGKWIDESYDDISNENVRAESVIRSLERFAKLSVTAKIEMIEQMQPVLQHNRRLLLDLKYWYGPILGTIEQHGAQ